MEPLNVLVVDDDRAIVDMVRLGLEADGMRVLGAEDGAEALEMLQREEVDVVLLDIMMPRVDGWMVLMQIRNDPSTADVPVIMVSAKNQDLARILAFQHGVQQYVTKPFNILELSARVSSLGKRRAGERRAEGREGEFRKLAVRKGGRTVLLGIDDIVFCAARNKSTYVHTYENQYLIDLTLRDLEARLGRETFFRLHRAYMINLNHLKEIVRGESDYGVVAADRDESVLPVSRRRSPAFKEAVGL